MQLTEGSTYDVTVSSYHAFERDMQMRVVLLGLHWLPTFALLGGDECLWVTASAGGMHLKIPADRILRIDQVSVN